MTIGDRLKPIFAVLAKDVLSEWRTRYAVSTILLFILTTITMIIIGTIGETLTPAVKAGLLWIIMFFGAMTGLSKSFVSEEERSTSLFLRTAVSSSAVFAGKLIFNVLMSILLNLFAVPMFFLFLDPPAGIDYGVFSASILLGSAGIGAASTIISAIIAKAGTKNAIFPVLSFPLLLPLIYCGIASTGLAFAGTGFSESSEYLVVMFAYSGAVAAFSFILFDYVWND